VTWVMEFEELSWATMFMQSREPKSAYQPNLVIRLFGLPGRAAAARTTLAVAIRALVRDAVILDGDDMRESISAESFSQEDRHAHNLRVARLAQVLSKQSSVIVSVIATFAETRRQINTITSPVWVLCRRFEQKEGAQFPYELPDTDEIEVLADGDACSPPENAFKIIEAIQRRRASRLD
jgi:hypothetical protein